MEINNFLLNTSVISEEFTTSYKYNFIIQNKLISYDSENMKLIKNQFQFF